jgi:hypothetical protein
MIDLQKTVSVDLSNQLCPSWDLVKVQSHVDAGFQRCLSTLSSLLPAMGRTAVVVSPSMTLGIRQARLTWPTPSNMYRSAIAWCQLQQQASCPRVGHIGPIQVSRGMPALNDQPKTCVLEDPGAEKISHHGITGTTPKQAKSGCPARITMPQMPAEGNQGRPGCPDWLVCMTSASLLVGTQT